MNRSFRKISTKTISLILTVIMVFSVMPVNMGILLKTEATVTRDGEERTVVIASSDYQYPNQESGNSTAISKPTSGEGLTRWNNYKDYIAAEATAAGVTQPYNYNGAALVVQKILTSMENDGIGKDDIEGFLQCGDFDYRMNANSATGYNSYNSAIAPWVGSDTISITLEGNHDRTAFGNSVFTATGGYDPASGAYGVFKINEDDFYTQNNGGLPNTTKENKVKAAANTLRTYLQAKIEEGYNKPIFILSHAPLYFSTRSTKEAGNTDQCSFYSYLLFDVINEAAAAGLNIVFLSGHDHSKDYEAYLGGNRVFLAPGDSINVPNGTEGGYTTETLNFTCMTAGYTGYYDCEDDTRVAAERTAGVIDSVDLTMSEFEIGENDMIINRYSLFHADDTDGDVKTVLKATGYENYWYKENKNSAGEVAKYGTGLTPTTNTYDSGLYLNLTYPVDTSYILSPVGTDTTGIARDADFVAYAYEPFVPAGDWIPVDGDGSAYYTVPAAGTYILTGNNGMLVNNAASSVTANGNTALPTGTETVDDGETDPYTVWTIAGSASDGYTVSTVIGGTTYYMKNDGTLTTANTKVTVSCDNADSLLTVGAFSGITAVPVKVTEIAAGHTCTYTLDTNGIDANEKYLIVAPSGTDTALVLDSSNKAALQSVTVSNNTITLESDAYDWVFSGSSSTSIKWDGGNNYLNTTTGSPVPVETSAMNFTVVNNNDGSYKFSFKSGTKTYYIRYSGSNSYFQNSTTTSSNSLRLYKLTTDETFSAGTEYKFSSAWTTKLNDSGVTYDTYAKLFDTDANEEKIVTTVNAGANESAILSAMAAAGITVQTSDSSYGEDAIGYALGSLSLGLPGAKLSTAGSYEIPVYYSDNDLGVSVLLGTVTVNVVGEEPSSEEPSSEEPSSEEPSSEEPSSEEPSSEEPSSEEPSSEEPSSEEPSSEEPSSEEPSSEDPTAPTAPTDPVEPGDKTPDNTGSWIPVDFDTTTTYTLPAVNKTYVLVGNTTGTLTNNGTTGASGNGVKTIPPTGENTMWKLEGSAAAGYRLYTEIGTAKYYLKSDGTLTTTQTNIGITADANNKLHIDGFNDAFAVYPVTKTEIAASTTHIYTLDTDGIDAGEKYLIVASSKDYALTLDDSNSIQRTSVDISDNKITMSSDANDWVLSGTTSGYVKWDAGNIYLRTNKSTIGTVTSSSDSSFTFSDQGSGNYRLYFTRSGSTYYLRYSSSSFSYNSTKNNVRLFKYTPTTTTAHTEYTYDSAWTTTSTSTEVPIEWAHLNANAYTDVVVGTTANAAQTKLLASESFAAFLSDYSDGRDYSVVENTDNALTFDWSNYDGSTVGTYSVPVKYNNIQIGTATVEVKNAVPVSWELDRYEGTVKQNASGVVTVTANMTFTYSDGSVVHVPVTLGMVSDGTDTGSALAKTPGDYTGLTVTYNGYTFNDFTLHVMPPDDYPEYPNEGSIKVGKSAQGVDFARTGVAKVELTATGVPLNPGIDVVIVLDTSSSMNATIGIATDGRTVFKEAQADKWYYEDYTPYTGSTSSIDTSDGKTRATELNKAVTKLMEDFSLPGSNGVQRDVDVAICTFNGFSMIDQGTKYSSTVTADASGSNAKNTRNTFKPTSITNDDIDPYTGSKVTETTSQSLNGGIAGEVREFLTGTINGADANNYRNYFLNRETAKDQLASVFVKPSDVADITNWINSTKYSSTATTGDLHSGTNYDDAFQKAYDLLKAKQAANSANGEERDSYVIFMSDGAPFQYNYFVSGHKITMWNTWIDGTFGTYSQAFQDRYLQSAVSSYAAPLKYFYNQDANKHWMAEAIKGDPDETYPIINRYNAAGSIDVTGDGVVDAYMDEVNGLGAKLYSIGFCLTEDGNTHAAAMQKLIKKLATSDEYYYEANSGEQLQGVFDSINNDIKVAASEAYYVDQMGTAYDIQMATNYTKNGVDYTLATPPTIDVIEHTVFTLNDYNNGLCDYDDIGMRRTGKEKTLESVSFNADGTEAYSNLDAAATDLIEEADGGYIINAHTFIYNLDKDKALNVDTDGDGTADYELPPETFYWKIGIIADKEYALNYYVYLTGSMEGKRAAGSYPTNNYANLYYINYVDNSCSVQAPVPKLPWEAANVSYEFYLVNLDGEPVNSEGTVVPFANRVLVGNRQTKEVLLNNTETTSAFVAAQLELPDGYRLYNVDAQYRVSINSGSDPSVATIIDEKPMVKDKDKVTTYYYGENNTYHINGVVPAENVTDYGNTHVAFAVIWEPTLIPDSIVIDYGLPVKINVLANDIALTSGTVINSVASSLPKGTELNNKAYDSAQIEKKTTLELAHGDVAMAGTGLIVYTPKNAEMTEEDVFYYEVNISGSYYYTKVTVYPAQNIYYEDSFFTFAPADTWKQVGTTYTDKYQSEDRPGEFNLSKIDFNNVYGYDPAYEDTAVTYSLGSAYKVNVSSSSPKPGANPDVNGKAAIAYFTFAGTGFDLFSVTSAATGAAMVQVYDSTGKRVKNNIVNTYYGYSYNVDKDEFAPAENAEDGLYQVPVIRVRDMTYDTYTVYVSPYYLSLYDMAKAGSYDFYVDGVRIYDPAGEKTDLSDSIQKVYGEDKEFNDTYVELRSNIISESNFYKLSDKELSAAAPTDFAPGMMFIDGIDELSGDVSGAYGKFSAYGPNNELYLTKGQAVAFYMQIDDCTAAPASVQLGMKVVGGSDAEGSLLVMNSAQEKPFIVAVNGAAARYKDISNAITWDPALVKGTSSSGFVTEDASAFVKAPEGDMSDYEWTLAKSGDNWMIGKTIKTEGGTSTSYITLTATENSGIKAEYGPNGTGDRFAINGENGVFTLMNTYGISLYSANGMLITGSVISEDNFALYQKTTDGYKKVNETSELTEGSYVIVSLASGNKFLCPDTETVTNEAGTYRTLYPIVVINNSDTIISLTNLKFAFNGEQKSEDSGDAPLKAPAPKLTSSAPARTFAMNAVKSFVLDGYVEEKEIDLSGVTVEWENEEADFGDKATLYVRTPDDIAAVTVDGVSVESFTDNGDGTKTWTYSFVIEEGADGTCNIVLKDADGNVSKTIETGELILPVVEPTTDEPVTDEPVTDEPDGEDEDGGKSPWWLDLLYRIIEFVKSIIRWWKSLL